MRLRNIISSTLVSKLAFNYAQIFGLAYCQYDFETHKVISSKPRLIYSILLNVTAIIIMPFWINYIFFKKYVKLRYPEDLVIIVYIVNSFIKYASVLVTFTSHWINQAKYYQIKSNIDNLETDFLYDKELTSLKDLEDNDNGFIFDVIVKFSVFMLTFIFTYMTIYVVEENPSVSFYCCWLYTVMLYKFLSISINQFNYMSLCCYKLFRIFECQLKTIDEMITIQRMNEEVCRMSKNYSRLVKITWSLSELYRWPILATTCTTYINTIVFIYFTYKIIFVEQFQILPLLVNFLNFVFGAVDSYLSVIVGTKIANIHKICQWRLSSIEISPLDRSLWKIVRIFKIIL